MPLSPYDHLFLLQCKAASKESHDPHRQVGVAIAGPAGHLLATGTNRPPLTTNLRLQDSHRAIAEDPQWKYFMIEHAERNAINNARELDHSLEGATMYGTLFPCADCARAIVAAGITRLVVPPPDSGSVRDEKWQAHYVYASCILELSRVRVDFVTPDDLLAAERGLRSTAT